MSHNKTKYAVPWFPADRPVCRLSCGPGGPLLVKPSHSHEKRRTCGYGRSCPDIALAVKPQLESATANRLPGGTSYGRRGSTGTDHRTHCDHGAGRWPWSQTSVRAEIQDRVPGRRWKHRLAEFNAEASFEDVKAVLTSAIAANVA
jgi:hypothetical protein